MTDKTQKTQSWLSGLLVVQIVVIAGFLIFGQKQQQHKQQQPIFSIVENQFDRIVMTDNNNTVSIQREADDVWLLPELQKLPANKGQIDDIVSTLINLKAGWPVATTSSSHKRFEVGEEQYQRRVQLYAGDTLVQEFFLGTSPGFRKVHMRKADENAVYAVSLNTYQFPVNVQDWLHKTLLSVPTVKSIKGQDYAVEKQAENWVFADSETSTEEAQPLVNADKTQQLVAALTELSVQRVAVDTVEGESIRLEGLR